MKCKVFARLSRQNALDAQTDGDFFLQEVAVVPGSLFLQCRTSVQLDVEVLTPMTGSL
jgi:hypothetical protein